MRGYDIAKPKVPYLSGPYGPALLNDFPQDIKAAVRVSPSNNLISFGDKAFNETKVYATDPGFFTLFLSR
jgi:putative ABC transport system permease protein